MDILEGSEQVPNRAPSSGRTSGSPWIMVLFTCSNAYVRVLRAHDGTHYLARCPRCGQCKRFGVGPGGTQERVFRLSC